MQIPKEFFQDKLALVLSGLSLVGLIAMITLTLIRAFGGGAGNYIVSYRANLGVEAFESGGLIDILSLIIVAVVIFAAQILLCWRIFLLEKRLAIGVLFGGLFLIILDLIVANALLALH